jgi:hypothetical protein
LKVAKSKYHLETFVDETAKSGVVYSIMSTESRACENILNLPREILALIINQYSNYVTKFLFFQTCHYALTLEECLTKIIKEQFSSEYHQNDIRNTALIDGSISVLEYLMGMGMTINSEEYQFRINVENIDVLLWIEDKVIYKKNKRFVPYILISRIMTKSKSEECIRYALFLDIDASDLDSARAVLPSKHEKNTSLSVSVQVMTALYDHSDLHMLEKMNIISRKHVLKFIKRDNDIVERIGRYVGPRLFKDGITIGGWHLTRQDYNLIAIQAFSYALINNNIYNNHHATARFRVADICISEHLVDLNLCTDMVFDAVRSCSYEGLIYCIGNKIPFPVKEDDHRFISSLKDADISYYITERFTICSAYENMSRVELNRPDFVIITKFLISLGMSIDPRIFSLCEFNSMRRIEAIELLCQNGALPTPIKNGLMRHVKRHAPLIVPRLLELGFKDESDYFYRDYEDYKNL